jgi:hypothetical protein
LVGNQFHGNPDILIVIFIEPCPQKCFVTTTEATSQAFGFTDETGLLG